MFLQVPIQRHGFLNHLLVQQRGIQQMQTVLAPHSESQMGNVEAFLVAGNGYDVAILNDRAQQPRVQQRRLGNIAESLSRQFFQQVS